LHCSTCQEIVDGILLAYKMAEDRRVRLPVIVNLDGFYLSFTREPVDIPDADHVAQFLPSFDPFNQGFQAVAPFNEAVAVLGGSSYSYFRYQTHLAAMNAEAVMSECAVLFAETFGRQYSAIESYRCDDAEVVFVMMGSFATKAKWQAWCCGCRSESCSGPWWRHPYGIGCTSLWSQR
jgi:pyruvate ferredoxin oxidoreductase alpha subunit